MKLPKVYNQPKKILIVELGPGDGSLCYDLLNTFKNFNTSYRILKYFSPVIKILSKLNIVPGTTYYKYFKF